MFGVMRDISESKLISSRQKLHSYDADELAELGYLYILSLRIILTEDETEEFGQHYCRKTARWGNFNTWRTDTTDLYVILYGLISDEAKLEPSDHHVRIHMPIDPLLVYRWIRNAADRRPDKALTHRLFVKLDTMFRIKDSSMRAIRRLVMDWNEITTTQRKLALTRLLQYMRSRASQGELLAKLNRVAVLRNLEIDDVENPEKNAVKEGGLLQSLAVESASAGATGASSIATAVGGLGAGFDQDYSRSVYPAPAKAKPTKVIKRLVESDETASEQVWDRFDEQLPTVAPNCKVSLREVSATTLEIMHIGVHW